MRRTAAAGGNGAAARRDDTGRSIAGDPLTADLRAIGLARAFAPPMLAVAVLHDEWWTGRFLGHGGYHASGFYASRSYAGGLHATSAVIATGPAGGPISRRHGGGFAMGRPAVGFQPGGPRGHVADFGGHGHGGSHGGGNGHDH